MVISTRMRNDWRKLITTSNHVHHAKDYTVIYRKSIDHRSFEASSQVQHFPLPLFEPPSPSRPVSYLRLEARESSDPEDLSGSWLLIQVWIVIRTGLDRFRVWLTSSPTGIRVGWFKKKCKKKLKQSLQFGDYKLIINTHYESHYIALLDREPIKIHLCEPKI